MKINVHELTLLGDSEFSKRFNRVSEAYEKWETSIGTENEDTNWKEYCSLKLCLEQGYPMGDPKEEK